MRKFTGEEIRELIKQDISRVLFKHYYYTRRINEEGNEEIIIEILED
jgi:hypothetical protein